MKHLLRFHTDAKLTSLKHPGKYFHMSCRNISDHGGEVRTCS